MIGAHTHTETNFYGFEVGGQLTSGQRARTTATAVVDGVVQITMDDPERYYDAITVAMKEDKIEMLILEKEGSEAMPAEVIYSNLRARLSERFHERNVMLEDSHMMGVKYENNRDDWFRLYVTFCMQRDDPRPGLLYSGEDFLIKPFHESMDSVTLGIVEGTVFLKYRANLPEIYVD